MYMYDFVYLWKNTPKHFFFLYSLQIQNNIPNFEFQIKSSFTCTYNKTLYNCLSIKYLHYHIQEIIAAICLFCISYNMSPVKRICVFEHSVMTNFNCACPAIQRGQGSGFLSEGSSWFTACMSEQRRFWRDCADAQARLNLRCSHRR